MARFQTYRCGGYSSYDGHCGATDCETCHPGGARQMAMEEATEELRSNLEELEARILILSGQLDLIDDEESEDYKALAHEIDQLTAKAEEIQSEISSIESGFDGDDYDGPDEDDRYEGEGEVNWESPY